MTTTDFGHLVREVPKKRVLWLVALVAFAVLTHEHLVQALMYSVTSLWGMAWIVLMGLLATAVLTATGSINVLVSTFDGSALSAIVLVSAIGAVLPVCGITVLPLVAGLLAAGVPLAPVMAFLLSSAVTDPEMFAITVATLGLPFAIGKTVSALFIGVASGLVTLALVQAGQFENPVRNSPMLDTLMPSSCCSPNQVQWRFWHDPERLRAFIQTCTSLGKLVMLWLGAAFVAEYFLKLYLPDDVLASWVGNDNRFAIPLAALVGTPLYLDGYAALPFVRGLMDRGMADGAAMTFLISGGMVSAWTAIPVFALLRLPVFLGYVIMAMIGAMLAGWGYVWIIS